MEEEPKIEETPEQKEAQKIIDKLFLEKEIKLEDLPIEKHAGGRPLEYNEEMVTKAQEYIDSCEDESEQELTGLSVKGTELYKNKLKVNLPTIEGLAFYLEVARETIYDWERKYPEFSDILGRLRVKQARSLINNGLSGDYNPTIAKVLLTKHGYREGIEQTGKDGKDLIPEPDTQAKINEAIGKILDTK